jgi:hypothetical protein
MESHELSSVMEGRTSLIGHSRKLSQKLELITGLPPSNERSSRNIEQANQEYPSKDGESNGKKLEEQSQ